ncbi:CPBP family intramembrane glutamic endopeptidase [Actinoplanes sp. NPDC051633]|uniref:CPBP family intramembrane glutamic endopeptidase n=1 Tax=Actinoplanes sp. NPDC051633 TaxID=3155670 RepID=UPI00343DD94D
MRKHPVLSFAILAIVPTWALQFLFLVLGWDLFGAKIAELFILLGAATLVTARINGRAGVRRLFAGVVRWRMGLGRFAFVLLAMPVLTLIVAAAGGALQWPAGGIGKDVLMYLFATLIFGALLGNVWEETAWAGFAQSRLTERHGLLRGALLTAIPFALIHLPLAWESNGLHDTSGKDLAITWAVLIVSAPFVRYLFGMTFADTGGSILAVGILHASVNASGALGSVDSWWPGTVAMVLLTVLVAASRRRRQARLDDLGYASAGSVSTLTR